MRWRKENNMEYYIQGDAANAERIKAAFERLGYDITYPDGCANPVALNIGVEIDGAKFVVPETLTYIHYIIKTHPGYKELELPKSHYDIANFQPFDHCRFKPTETHDWIYADFWYIQAHYKVEHLFAIEKWES